MHASNVRAPEESGRDRSPSAPAKDPRILFVTHTGQLGGAEFELIDVAAPHRRRCAVQLFEDGPLAARLRSVGVEVLPTDGPGGLRRIKRDRTLLRALPSMGALARWVVRVARTAARYDVIYANSQKGFVVSALAARLSRRPLVWHLHDIFEASHFGALQRKLPPRLANWSAARVIVASQAAARAFVSEGGDPSRLRVVPYGFEPDDAADATIDRAAARRELGLPQGFMIGVFSRLSPWKGQHVVLEALRLLPGTACVFAGSPLFGEDGYANGLRRRADELGLSRRALFLGHRDDVPRLMRLMDVVIHPSTAPEPFGRTLVEAMLAERPVVATDFGAAPEIVVDGETGLLVPSGNAAALARAVDRLRLDPDLRARMGERGRERARGIFPLARMRCEIDTIVGEVVA